MQRKTITLLAVAGLLAAGLLTAAATDLAPTASSPDPMTDPAALDADACLAAEPDPAFPQDAQVQEWTGNVPNGTTSAELDLTAWHGGIVLTTWDQPTWRVEVAEVDSQDRLEPTVEGTVNGDTLQLEVNITDTNAVEVPHVGSVSVSANDDPTAHLKVWIPTVHVERAVLQDEVSHSGVNVNVDDVDPDEVPPSVNDTHEREGFPVQVTNLQGSTLNVHVDNTDAVLANLNLEQVRVDTDNGDVDGRYLTADQANLASDNGDLCLADSTVSQMTVDTDNGDVDIHNLGVVSFHATADNGHLNAGLVPTASGTITADSDNGDVTLTLPTGERYGYDVGATSDNGDVTVNLPGTDTTHSGDDPTSVHARTQGYADKDVRTTVSVQTDNGDIVVT